MARRDELDQHIMQPATDAIVLCSDKFTPEEEVTYILALFDAL
jgi:cytidylate kinase (EC 2.7.4.14)